MINWNAINKKKLSDLYQAGKTDAEITASFPGAGTYAIAKQRSTMGLVKNKMPKGIKRKARSLYYQAADKMFYVAHYQENGMNHFSRLDTEDEEAAKQMIRALMCKRNLSSVILLCPTTKLIIQKVTEIKL